METREKCCETCLWCYDENDIKNYSPFGDEEIPEVGECIMLMKKLHTGKPYCESYTAIPELEKNYVVYDDKYLGPGYFIINEIDGEIQKFIKIYISNNEGLPIYNIRAYEKGRVDNPDSSFSSINFDFSYNKDVKLQEAIYRLSQLINMKPIITINPSSKGKNQLLTKGNPKHSKIIISKDVWNGKEVCTDFIDIILGDNYTCEYYEAINDFYNDLSKISINKKETVSRILKI